MKNRALLFISIIIAIVLAAGCGQTIGVSRLSTRYPATFTYTQTLTRHQLDSVCVVEGINSDLSMWIRHTMKDFETGSSANQWLYITDRGGYTIYDLTQKAENEYVFSKREIKGK